METIVKIRKLVFAIFVAISGTMLIACSSGSDADGEDKGTENAYKATGTIDGHEYVDLGLSVSWATCNIGASNPYENGDYYPFYYWGTQSVKNVPYDICGTVWDRATHLWGKKWRMPSYSEIQELAKCKWTTFEKNGHKYAKVQGQNGNCIIMPFNGHRMYDEAMDYNAESPCNGELCNENEFVQLWSGTRLHKNEYYQYYPNISYDPYISLLFPNDWDKKLHTDLGASSFCYAIRPVTQVGNSSNQGGNGDSTGGGSTGGSTSYEKPDIAFNDFTAYQTKLKVVYKIYNKDKAKVTSAKVYYGTSSNPTKSVSATVAGVLITANISGLKKGTTYYVKCVATGKGGTTTTETTKVITNY